MRALFALFIRSVREDTRAKLPVILRVALIGLILLIIWANQRDFTRSAPGLRFFGYVMMLNLGFIPIAALSIFPSAITEEKEDETLPLLRMTNLNPLSILLGKSTSRLLGALLLLAVQIPFTLLAITLGGVSFPQILMGYAILGATTFFLCNLALFLSVVCRTTMRASLLVGTMGVLLYVVGPIVASGKYFNRMFGGTAPTHTWKDALCTFAIESNPMYSIIMLIESSFRGSPPKTTGRQSITFSLIAGALCFLLAWVVFDRFCSGSEVVLGRRKKASPRGIIRRQKSRAWRRWPIVWKEMHFATGGRRGFWIRAALAAAVYVGAYFMARSANPDPQYYIWDDVGGIALFIIAWIAAFDICLIASRLFGVERERQTLSSLATLPWSVGRIIRQKIAGVLPALIPWFLFALLACIPLSRDTKMDWVFRLYVSNDFWRDLPGICYGLSQSLLLLITTVWFSLRIRRGALPATMVMMVIWNIAFAMWMDGLSNRGENFGLITGAILSLVVLLFLAKGIHTRIQTAAAEA